MEDEETNLSWIIWLYPKEFSLNAIISSKENPTEDAKWDDWTIEPCFMVALAE